MQELVYSWDAAEDLTECEGQVIANMRLWRQAETDADLRACLKAWSDIRFGVGVYISMRGGQGYTDAEAQEYLCASGDHKYTPEEARLFADIAKMHRECAERNKKYHQGKDKDTRYDVAGALDYMTLAGDGTETADEGA